MSNSLNLQMFPLFESFSGRLPDTEELLKQTDLTALKRCLLATQVKIIWFRLLPFYGQPINLPQVQFHVPKGWLTRQFSQRTQALTPGKKFWRHFWRHWNLILPLVAYDLADKIGVCKSALKNIKWLWYFYVKDNDLF